VIYLINMSSEQDTKLVQRPEDLNCETGMNAHLSLQKRKLNGLYSHMTYMFFFFQINAKETAVITSVIL